MVAALAFWTVIALWLLAWALPFIVAGLQLAIELTLWGLLVVCGRAMAAVEVVEAMGAHLARRRRKGPIHISNFDMA